MFMRNLHKYVILVLYNSHSLSLNVIVSAMKHMNCINSLFISRKCLLQLPSIRFAVFASHPPDRLEPESSGSGVFSEQ